MKLSLTTQIARPLSRAMSTLGIPPTRTMITTLIVGFTVLGVLWSLRHAVLSAARSEAGSYVLYSIVLAGVLNGWRRARQMTHAREQDEKFDKEHPDSLPASLREEPTAVDKLSASRQAEMNDPVAAVLLFIAMCVFLWWVDSSGWPWWQAGLVYLVSGAGLVPALCAFFVLGGKMDSLTMLAVYALVLL